MHIVCQNDDHNFFAVCMYIASLTPTLRAATTCYLSLYDTPLGKKTHPPDEKDTVHVNPNPVYEYTKVPKCRRNPAYNVVVPLLQQ